jgi:xanthine dehydrogenase accessory factor
VAGGTQDILAEAAALGKRREPYVLATVVWRHRPTSGKAGSRALVTPDGRLRGWVGGACAEPTVVREALRALEEGTPRLLCLGSAELFPASGEGRVVEPITCSSEGAMEVFVEPCLPRPQLVVVGRAPVAATLASLGGVVGFEVAVLGNEAEDAAPGDLAAELARLAVGQGSFVVVATMGRFDEEALAAALATEAPYVALVASRKRAGVVLERLRHHGVSEEKVQSVHAPAGLDLGPIAHEEIAVAILAEIVQQKARGVGAVRPAVARPEEAVDPVCGMTVTIAGARYTAEHAGRTYYFCCGGCREHFLADPESVLAMSGGSHHGG